MAAMADHLFYPTGAALKLLLLGGQKSGKSRQAELLARQWLQADASHRASLIATGTAYDAEMRERIARHQRDRAERVAQLATLEAPRAVAQAIAAHSSPQHLLIVDCLTLWLTNWLMPAPDLVTPQDDEDTWPAQAALFLQALQQAPGPVILVSNEIGLGVIPLGREVRAFVDALGTLNQQTAAVCNRVTFMAAGLPLQMK
jgi:adenosylcobinamide kinase/adenosylcobinamide-phosphate guanylyltransferase